jgi:hypothetical protein
MLHLLLLKRPSLINPHPVLQIGRLHPFFILVGTQSPTNQKPGNTKSPAAA